MLGVGRLRKGLNQIDIYFSELFFAQRDKERNLESELLRNPEKKRLPEGRVVNDQFPNGGPSDCRAIRSKTYRCRQRVPPLRATARQVRNSHIAGWDKLCG